MAHDWDGLREAFLVQVKSRTGSVASHRQYKGLLRRFFTRHPDPGAVTVADCHAFGYGLGPTGRAPGAACIALRLAVLRSWFEFLLQMEVLERNPARRVAKPKIQRKPFSSLSTDQLLAFFRAFPDHVKLGPLYRAAAFALLYTGLRRQALVTIIARDIRFRDGKCFFRAREKGGVEIEEELPPPVYEAIAEAARAVGRPLDRLHPEDRIFPFAGNTLLGWISRAGLKAGLGRVHCHRLRHQAAMLQHLHGATPEEISSFLHHSNLAVTTSYIKTVIAPKRPTRWREISASVRLDRIV